MKKIGYATGVFDMFHVGHLNLIRRAKLECDYLIVGVTTDELVFELKGRMPIIPLEERIEIIQSIKFVDDVVPEISVDKLSAWKNLNFDITFKGSDWKGSEKWVQLEKEFSERGVEVFYLPYTEHTSSTKLRKTLEFMYKSMTDEGDGI